jgi:hypothetical protein
LTTVSGRFVFTSAVTDAADGLLSVVGLEVTTRLAAMVIAWRLELIAFSCSHDHRKISAGANSRRELAPVPGSARATSTGTAAHRILGR